MWQKLNTESKEVDDDIFKYIDKYQNKWIEKYSVDDVLLRKGIIEETKRNKEDINESQDELTSPVSLINLTGINFEIININEDEKEKDILTYGDIKEPNKVYQPISVHFSRGF